MRTLPKFLLASALTLLVSQPGSAYDEADLQKLRTTKSCPGCDLSRAQIWGERALPAELDSANLQGANLSSSNLDRARLRRANLSGANLSEANLSGAYLTNANLTNTDLRKTDLFGAYLKGANLAGANLFGVRIDSATIWPKGFKKPKTLEQDNAGMTQGIAEIIRLIEEANYCDTEADCKKTVFSGEGGCLHPCHSPSLVNRSHDLAPIHDAINALATNHPNAQCLRIHVSCPVPMPPKLDLRGKSNTYACQNHKCVIEQKEWTITELISKWQETGECVGCFLVDANLSGAKLSGLDLTHADLRRADLTGAVLSYAKLWDADLSDSNLNKANLTEAYLTKANLTGASLIEANLFESTLSGASLRGANLTKANLSGVDASQTRLVSANLTEADLVEARLHFANLEKANLTGANLTGAILSRAILRQVNLTKANLTGAELYGADLEGTVFCNTKMPDGTINNSGCSN